VTQNETNAQAQACEMAKRLGLRVAYAAAPFDAGAVQAVLPHIDMLIMNQVEADQLTNALGLRPDQMDVQDVIITLGADGCRWFDNQMGRVHEHAAIPADVVDTTGAGDTFTGYILAGLDRGMRYSRSKGYSGQVWKRLILGKVLQNLMIYANPNKGWVYIERGPQAPQSCLV